MNAWYRLNDGGRIDVETVKDSRRVRIEFRRGDPEIDTIITLTLSEARAISSALMGAAAEA